MSLDNLPAVRAAVEQNRAKEAAFAALPLHNLSIEEANGFVLRWATNYDRMEMLLKLRPLMDYGDWLTVLGRQWTRLDHVHYFAAELRDRLGTSGPLLPMMTREEQTAYDALPDHHLSGLLCPHCQGHDLVIGPEGRAAFAYFSGYRAWDPVLVTATVRKENILAVLLGGEAPEVITFKARRSQIEALPTTGPGAESVKKSPGRP